METTKMAPALAEHGGLAVGVDLNTAPWTLSPRELAQCLDIGERQAREFIASGGIYSFRVGRRILVPKAAVRRLLECSESGKEPRL